MGNTPATTFWSSVWIVALWGSAVAGPPYKALCKALPFQRHFTSTPIVFSERRTFDPKFEQFSSGTAKLYMVLALSQTSHDGGEWTDYKHSSIYQPGTSPLDLPQIDFRHKIYILSFRIQVNSVSAFIHFKIDVANQRRKCFLTVWRVKQQLHLVRWSGWSARKNVNSNSASIVLTIYNECNHPSHHLSQPLLCCQKFVLSRSSPGSIRK